jgi:hypothetical protein
VSLADIEVPKVPEPGYYISGTYVGKHYNKIVLDDLGSTFNQAMTSIGTPSQSPDPYAKYLNDRQAAQAQPYDLTKANLFFTKPTPTNMTRLTTHNDWTIALRDNKLIAFDSKGNTVEAVGKIISAGGNAWMWDNGTLYTGVLAPVKTEKQIELERISKEKDKVVKKYEKRVNAAHEKAEKLQHAFQEEYQNVK